MRALAVVLAAMAIAGCLRDPTACDDGRLCPAGTVCHAGGCATEEQIAACAGLAADAACTTSQIGLGVCVGGACVAQTCGNAHLDPAESCEGTMLRETTCAAIFAGYDGELACTDSCTYDTSGCAGSCGDAIVNGPETCDGPIADPSCLAEDRDFGLVACTACQRSLAGCRSFGWSREVAIDARVTAAVGPETLVVADGNQLHLLDLATSALTPIVTPDFLANGIAVTAAGTIVIPGMRLTCTLNCTSTKATWVGTIDGTGMLHEHPASSPEVGGPVAVGTDVYATTPQGYIHRWVDDHWELESIVDPVLGAARGPIASDGTSLFAVVSPFPAQLVRRTGPSALELVGTVNGNVHLLAALPGGDLVASTNQGQSWRVSVDKTTLLDYGRDSIWPVTAIRATPDGRTLAATAVGTAMLEGFRWSYLDSGITYDVTATADGSIFAGRSSGLWRLRPDRWQKLGHANQGSITVDLPWPAQPAYLVGGPDTVILVPGRMAAPFDALIACTTPVARYFYTGMYYTRCVDTVCDSNPLLLPGRIACDPTRDRSYFSSEGTLQVMDGDAGGGVATNGRVSSISVVPGTGALLAGRATAEDTGVIQRFVDGAAMTEVVPGPTNALGQPVEDPFTAIHACSLDDWFVSTRGHVYRQVNGVTTAWTLPENETIARIAASPDCSVVYAQSQQTLFRYTTTDPRWIPIRAPGPSAMAGIVYTDEGPIVSGNDGVHLLVLED